MVLEPAHIKFFNRAAVGAGHMGQLAPRWLAMWIAAQQLALNRSYGSAMGTSGTPRGGATGVGPF